MNTTSAPTQALNVFLSYSSDDKAKVRDLYRYLVSAGFDVWMDEKKLLPGQDFDYEINTALHKADAVIVVFSKNMVQKEGYIQKELRMALDRSQEKPEGTIYLIPARLEECDVPSKWRHLQYIDLNQPDSGRKLIEALNTRARSLHSKQQSIPRVQLMMDSFNEAEPVHAVQVEQTELPVEYRESLQFVHFYGMRLFSVAMGFFAALNLRWLCAAYSAVNNTDLLSTITHAIASSDLVFAVMALGAMLGAGALSHYLDLFQFERVGMPEGIRYVLAMIVGFLTGTVLNILGIVFLLFVLPCLLSLLLIGGGIALYLFSRSS
jgi:hypothetical protein